jgi:hypothetical protein
MSLGPSWEGMPYLDRIWSLPQLPWAARTRLLEMHQAGVLEEGDLSAATLRSLNNSGLGREAMEQVLSDFRGLASSAQHGAPGAAAGAAQHGASGAAAGSAQHGASRAAAGSAQHGAPGAAAGAARAGASPSPGWVNDTLLELLQGRQVRQWGPTAALAPRCRPCCRGRAAEHPAATTTSALTIHAPTYQ